ncbi:MAG: electron transfer flavoprotein subunit alpha/FixB family protein [Geminicoccaceae bacterium]|nr:electron transfer flavoprotein subunit alpha/FixB family protein [Geminicoccaceae bacterium]HRY26269.1 FAD-binding protein [Geminicoccaceae bacterium]
MAVLILAQHDNQTLDPAVLHAVTAAAALPGPMHVLVAGAECGAVAEAAAKIAGIEKVIRVEHSAYANPVAEDLTPLVVAMAADYDYVLAASTTFSRNLLPRVAALLDTAQLSDIVEVVSPSTFRRYVYAGNALTTVESKDEKRVITVRTTTFEAAPAEGGSAEITTVAAVDPAGLARFVGREVQSSARPDLTSARVVVSGGRGIGSAENFSIVEALADTLGAAVGASRAAVDAGYAPNDWQVGQTGKIVAPDLYIAVGISGAIQHLAGMKDSKVIVAINKDEEAPIFQVADYAIVGDLFKLVPELTEALRQAKG